MFLSPEEVHALTGYRQRPAQVRALAKMGITHRVRPDGSPVVCKEALTSDLPKAKLKSTEPNWSAMSEEATT